MKGGISLTDSIRRTTHGAEFGGEMRMRILSLSRPWPWAIFEAGKSIENRSWAPPIDAIGQRLALQAAKSWDDSAFPFLLKFGLAPPARFDLHPHSMIIGVATIDRVVTEARTLTSDQRKWFFEVRADGKQNYGWLLTDIRKLHTPMPYPGAQGLRYLPADVTRTIERDINA